MSVAALFDLSDRVFAAGDRQAFPSLGVRIAGCKVELQFASAHAAQVIGPTFRHLEPAGPGEPDLTIRVWDAAGSALPAPVLALPEASTGAAHFTGETQGFVDLETGRVEAYDPRRRLGLLFVPDLALLDPGYAAAPLRTLLHWWAIDHGWLLLHAGCVANEHGGALLVGRGGSGKSTTVLACIGSSLRILSDDYCLYQPGIPAQAHSLFGSNKIDARAVSLMPHLAPAFADAPLDPKGKGIIQAGEWFAGSQCLSAPLRAIFVPSVGTARKCSFQRISAGDALKALAPSTVFQLAGGRTNALATMARLVRGLPCWKLAIGPDPTAAREPIANIISASARTA